MKIKRLYIKDFGIFRDQRLEDLAPGMVVIGGPNRAGKTTLLHILRYLWYGFPPGGSLPPATRKYEVNGDIILDTGEEVNIYLEGQARPKLSFGSGGEKDATIEDLIRLDPFIYHRLFTISLDELRSIPAGVDDTERLQSILLGAGLGEILMIPQIEEELGKNAYKIGCSKGDPSTGSFKAWYKNIKDGIKLRQEALNQVEEYEEKKKELETVRERISTLEEESIPELDFKQTALDVLKNNYDDYQEKEKLRLQLDQPEVQDLLQNFPGDRVEKANSLQERYQQALEDYKHQLTRFRQEVTGEKIKEIKGKFLEHKDELRQYSRQLSGLKEKVSNYFRQVEEYRDEENELDVEMKQINSSWEDFESLEEIRTDRLEQDALNRNVVAYSELQKEYKDCGREVEELEAEKKRLEEQLVPEAEEPAAGLKKYFILAVIFTLGGIGLSFIHTAAGLILGLAGVIGYAFYLWNKSIAGKGHRESQEQIQRQIEDVESRLASRQKELEDIKEKLLPLGTALQEYRRVLGLGDDISPEMIRIYFNRVQELKRKLYRWKQQGQVLDRTARVLDEELQQIEMLLQQFTDIIDGRPLIHYREQNSTEERIRAGEKMFVLVEQLDEYLKLALELDDREKKVKEVEKEICRLLQVDDETVDLMDELNKFLKRGQDYEQYKALEFRYRLLEGQILSNLKTDRVHRALKNLALKHDDEKMILFADDDSDEIKSNDFNDDRLLTAFTNLYSYYTSLEDVENDFTETKNRLEQLKEELEGLKSKRQSLQDKLEDLATTEKLEEAQRQIDRARAAMKPLAEKYAVYRAAAFILSQVRTRFMERAKDKLLNRASRVLEQITGGEYSQILPPENLTETDFQTVLSDGRKQGTVNILSRGTKEQLFLAIRVSRLREIDPPLPVIVDDSLVNFDMQHLDNTIDILSDLAATHQIFILTCHPHLVESIASKNSEAQYWKLDRGKFSLSTGEELLKELLHKSHRVMLCP